MNMNNGNSSNTNTNIKLSDILGTIKVNGGYLPTHELAIMLGKRHDNLIRKLESQGVQLLNLRGCKVESKRNNGGIQVYTSYLLNDEQAVALAMSYDMQLGVLVYRSFKSALEVVDAVNRGEAPELIAEEAEEATFQALFESAKQFVCLSATANKKANQSILKVCVKMASVEVGGVIAAYSNLTEFYKSFAIQAELRGLPLRAHYKEVAKRTVNAAFGITKDAERALRKHEAVFIGW
ncbi:hypothetical protein RYR28_002720 [Edwardsiella piscicida]|uniref:hypothetical protein n=1 Tax=Edwardsiella piscicida TaxID=1263550 RepID=UPI002915082E|nr:hypothetical protein [Edwardsiella piscicida]